MKQEAQARQTLDSRGPWKLLGSLLAPYGGMAVGTLVLLLADITGMLLIPTELSALLNAAIDGASTDVLAGHAVAMLVASLVGSGACIASYWLATRLAARVGRDLRVAVYRKSLQLGGSEFQSIGTGSMITRTLGDANVVQQSLVTSFLMLAPLPVICVVSMVLAYSIDPVMGRLLLAVTLAMAAISTVAVVKSAPIFVRMQELVDRMNARLREAITGVRVIRAFGRERQQRRRLDDTFEGYAQSAIRVNLVFAVTDCSCFCLMNLVEFGVMWVGADRVGAHAMQIGSITALVQYAMLILFFMMMAQFAIIQLPRAIACLRRACQLFGIEPRIKDPQVAGAAAGQTASMAAPGQEPAAAAPAQGDDVVASFRHACFRYDDASEDTLHDVSFDIRRGQTCAIIGGTGSGKSTVAKMLLRFHDVTSGQLLVCGRDVRDVPQDQLRGRLAYVPQTAWLFSGTIAQNLRDADPQTTDEALWHALDVAQADFVRDLPDGLNAQVEQGGKNFSGGQRQRLAIARALVRQAQLYVFDDSFSALDYRTDAALRRRLASELGSAAVLIIAQRVSTIRDADQIVVLDDGRVVGRGTHQQLMRTCPTYQDIVESQTRGGDADE